MMPGRAVAAVLIGLTLGGCSYLERPPRIVSAKRGREVRSGTSELRPTNAASDVVLVVEIAGLTREEFEKVKGDTIHVMAGDEKRGPHITQVATRGDSRKAEIKIAFVVPEKSSRMQLLIGDYPPKKFNVSGMVDRLQM